MKVLKRGTPATEPITLEQARDFLRLDTFGSPATHPDDALITVFISAARSWCETYMNHSIPYRTVTATYDKFSGDYLDLQEWPVTSVDSVTYVDSDGVTQTWDSSNYVLDSVSVPCRLYRAVGVDWPNTQSQINVVNVQFNAGYTDTISPNDYPTPTEVTHGIYLMLAHFYENRQQVGKKLESMPYGVESLIHPHRINLGV